MGGPGAAGVKDIGTMLGEEKSAKLMPWLLLSDFGCCLSCSLSGVGSLGVGDGHR